MSNWDNIKRIDSEEGNVAKFVFANNSAVAEAVLYRYPTYKERTVICCSTMSGCPVGCRFCGAGDYFVKSLSDDEIVSQVEHCLSETDVHPRMIDKLQIMFMSMGEPLLNKIGMERAIIRLHALYPHAALLISTIGPEINYEWVYEVSEKVPTVGLQFSVHKSTDEERNKLIPFKKKLSLKEIAEVGLEWHRRTGRSPYFNYCAGDDNTDDINANDLLALFDPRIWSATVSVICERNEGMPAKNERQIELAANFSSKLLERGYDVRVFDPAGQDDIGGGCGQLWFVQQWMQTNPDFAKPSIGHGLPTVHTPMPETKGEIQWAE